MEKRMYVRKMKCGRCNHRFDVTFIDRNDPKDRDLPPGGPPRCPECGSMMVEPVDKVRRAS
jgi:hypothetical protein